MKRFASVPAIAGTIIVLALLAACTTTPSAPAEAPEPPPLPPHATIEKMSADALFAFGKYTIDETSEGAAALEALANRLVASAHPIKTINVIGHSDRIGSDVANIVLSTRRAETVRDYLLSRGVQAELVTAVGRGSIEPEVECEGESGDALVACLAPNRRVEVRASYRD